MPLAGPTCYVTPWVQPSEPWPTTTRSSLPPGASSRGAASLPAPQRWRQPPPLRRQRRPRRPAAVSWPTSAPPPTPTPARESTASSSMHPAASSRRSTPTRAAASTRLGWPSIRRARTCMRSTPPRAATARTARQRLRHQPGRRRAHPAQYEDAAGSALPVQRASVGQVALCGQLRRRQRRGAASGADGKLGAARDVVAIP